MNEYCILNSENIIENIIVCDETFAESIGAKPSYDHAFVGIPYNPPPAPPTIEEQVATLQAESKMQSAQIQAQSDRSDFLEDCIAEMAAQVYS